MESAKKPRKVALINVADYPRERYSAYWTISVLGDDDEGYRWQANVHAYEPVAWSYKGKTTSARPEAPWAVYPGDIPVKQDAYLKMTEEQRAGVRAAQEARRAECARIYDAHPKPVFDLAEKMGVEDARDAADTAAQKWVLEQMKKHRRPAGKQSGHALVTAVSGWFIIEALFAALRRLLLPLIFMALGYSSTARNNRLAAVRDLIDGGAGAGLLRIYDGSRPATCGAATTLLAELTCSDPCAGAPAAGVLTLSAITADASANASGTATWHRFVDSTGTCVVDGNCGTSGSDMNLNVTTVTAGVQFSVTSYVITGGNA